MLRKRWMLKKKTADLSIPLRSSRDDKFVARRASFDLDAGVPRVVQVTVVMPANHLLPQRISFSRP
jgi:hypothetical protein